MKNDAYLKEFKEIRKIYEIIISNYSELNRMFDINNPIQIYLIYMLSLYNGYLSKTDNFRYYDNEDAFLNYTNLNGADILNGYGVCRHISAMLKDIYDNMGINNEILPIYLNRKKHLYKLINYNHVINIVSDDTKGYLLDPTNGFIWDKVGKKLLCHINIKDISIASIANQVYFLVFNDYNIDRLKNIKNMLSKTCHLTKEDMILLEHIDDIFNSNLSTFEEFKNENIKYYSEVTERLTDLKSKILKK